MSDAFDALAQDLAGRSKREWELLIIADWPSYSVSKWPTSHHQPFAPALPPEDWCKVVRDIRASVFTQLGKAQGPAIDAAEERAKRASTSVAVRTAGHWTNLEGLPMHVQAAKSVLWFAALYPIITDRHLQALWFPYSSVAKYLDEFAQEHLRLRAEQPEPVSRVSILSRFSRAVDPAKAEKDARKLRLAIAAKRMFLAGIAPSDKLSDGARTGAIAYLETFDKTFESARAAGQTPNQAAITADAAAEVASKLVSVTHRG